MLSSNFHIINASAGSGKTYTLVLLYLKKLLASESPRPYRHMLALTFTNKAVNEMKLRILECLHTLSNPDTKAKSLQEKLMDLLEIDAQELARRAEKNLRNIILEYGSFDIITLDKFTHRIVRTFAKEFDLPQGFDIALDSSTLLGQVVRAVINQIGSDSFITSLLLKLSLSKLEQGLSWDIQSDLDEFTALILSENDRLPLEDLREKDQRQHNDDRKKLKKALVAADEKIQNLTQKLHELLEKNTLTAADFSRQLLHKHLDLLAEKEYEKCYKNQLEKMLSGHIPCYKKTTSSSKKEIIDQLLPQIYSQFLAIKKEVGYFILLKKTLRYWTPRVLLNQIERVLNDLQLEKEVQLLGAFNQKISKLVQQETAPFIYSRIGERYQHYFIDEFQDTSSLQWSNLIPLISNSLESENLRGEKGSLVLVGDPKQAIYRWRGGAINQFIDLLTEESRPFQIAPSINRLETNYRSEEAIVRFNNAFFNNLTKVLSDSTVQSIYGKESLQQINKSGGYVQLAAVPICKTQDEKIPFYIQETLNAVRKALSLNYKQKDIALLVRTRKQAVIIGEALVAEKYNILSSESLIVSKSSQIQLLIAILKLYIEPHNNSLHKIIFDHLWNWKKLKGDYHSLANQYIHLTTSQFFEELKKSYELGFNFQKSRNLPLVQLVDSVICAFPCINSNSPFIEAFLEDLFIFSRQKEATIGNYLIHWEIQKEKLRVATPKRADAINVMTIHQAKGLEFPIVILPFMDTPLSPNLRDKIWFPLHHTPLNEVQWGWIGYSQQLELFGQIGEKIYQTQQSAKIIDALNVLYVALTRARSQLYIITQKGEVADTPKNYADLFQDFISKQGQVLEESVPCIFGTALPNNEQEENLEYPSIELNGKISEQWKQNLIAPPATNRAAEDAKKEGILMHDLLAKMRDKERINEILEEELIKGRIEFVVKERLKKQLNQIINHPQLSYYFDGNDQVYCERELLLPKGPTLRPDRINISAEGQVTVLDYKTGKYSEKHKVQLMNYTEALEQLGFDHIEAKLVYIGASIEVKKIE